jgi:hypothetical protein
MDVKENISQMINVTKIRASANIRACIKLPDLHVWNTQL